MENKLQLQQEEFVHSSFFFKVCGIVEAIDQYSDKLAAESDYWQSEVYRKIIDESLCKWEVAKLALEFITGKTYAFTRTDECYGIVNEADENDWLYRQLK